MAKKLSNISSNLVKINKKEMTNFLKIGYDFGIIGYDFENKV
jgi:hypothetical protein